MALVQEKIKPQQKPDILLEAVMTKTPDEAEKVYRSLGTVDFTAYALGLACRFRGLETVKMLIENGARFDYDVTKIKRAWRYDPLINGGVNYAAAMLDYVGIVELNDLDFLSEKYGVQPIPVNERLKVIDFLCGTAEKTGFDKDELYFYSFFSCDRGITDHLKTKGAKIPEMRVKIITEGGWDDETKSKWFDYCYLTEKIRDNDFIPCITALVTELGGQKLHGTEWLWHLGLESRLKIPGSFKFFFEIYEFSKINKGQTMKQMIDCGSIDGLAAAAELGWLKQPKKRDDGTLVITGYKGDKTEITVPERIGRDIVTAIGEYAFSPEAKRLKYEQHKFRKTITEVKLPDTITEIGEGAFLDCLALVNFELPPKITEISKECFRLTAIKEIVIGGKVKKIGFSAFSWCFDLKTAVLCEGVEEIGGAAFYNCGDLETLEIPRSVTKIIKSGEFDDPFFVDGKLTVVLYKGSYAEKFCIENKIPFKYKMQFPQ